MPSFRFLIAWHAGQVLVVSEVFVFSERCEQKVAKENGADVEHRWFIVYLRFI